MLQVNVRLDDVLAAALKEQAAEEGRSVNAVMSDLVRAYVDPSAAGTEIERMRERLRRSGLLGPPLADVPSAPDPKTLARARRAAGAGDRTAAEYVLDGRS